jgi:signal transduction histidine kinase
MMLQMQEQDLILPVLAIGAVAAVVRATGSGRAKTARGRLRDLAWYAALLILSVFVLSTVNGGLAGRPAAWGLLIPLAATIIIALEPGWVQRIVPWALVAYGLSGFAVLRDYAIGSGNTTYGLYTTSNWDLEVEFVLVQAYVFLLLGLWLLWRATWIIADGAPRREWRWLGRAIEMPPRVRLQALLLVPTAIAVVALVGPMLGWIAGAILAALVLAGTIAVLRRRPDIAAKSAAVTIAALGVVGLAVAAGVSPAGFGYMWIGPGSGGLLVGPFHAVGSDYTQIGQLARGILLGPILVISQQTRVAAAIESIGLLAVGGWLVPQTFPRVRRLFGLAPNAELLSRVRQLTESRADAVDNASADLRRLERDLHDGAQARLVALGMSLRAAERLIPTSPEAAIALVAEARETSARALNELRELVRGVLPPVLADRGLADAVRALALDCPLAVETDIDLPGRPPAPVETACYFAVAEVLTNAAKHSGSRAARIAISHTRGVLRIEVTDFGLGGADPAAGSGLAGVERRLATFDGMLVVSSPIGGPTIVVMEVPCVLSSPRTSSS